MQNPQNTNHAVLVLDIGGRFIKSAVFQSGKLIRKLPQTPSCSCGSREEIASAIRGAIRQAGPVGRIAVSIPGPFDYENGIFRAERRFAAVRDCNFAEFTDGLPASFVHNANAFVLGELLHGAGCGFLRVGGVMLGTGLGTAFSIGGDLQNDRAGSPSETVSLRNRPYLDGIADDYVSARALLKNFPGMNAEDLEEAAASGNASAREAWKEYSRHLYDLLSGWKNRLDPEVIILGGHLGRGLFFGLPVPAELNIRFSGLGEDAVLWGAYEHARRNGEKILGEPSEDQLRRAIISTGNPGPYQHFLKRAEKGEHLTVGVLGGSITFGAACSDPEKQYHGVLLDFLRKRYPRSCFSLAKAGIGATNSVYGAFRAERDLLSRKPDLAILEFAVNDADGSLWAQSYEGIVRQILAQGCPLILLFMTHNHQHNCQRFQTVIGRHYDLAMVSFHDAVMPELMNGHLLWDEISKDEVHPKPAAHSFAGKLLCALLDRISTLPEKLPGALQGKLFSAEFEHTFLKEEDQFQPDKAQGWRMIPADDPRGKSFTGSWFASEPGSSMSFHFEGASLYLSYLGIEGPVGRISVQVDRRPPVMVESFFHHDWNGVKRFWVEIASGLEQGKHQATVVLLPEHHPDGGNEFYFRGIAGTYGKD